MDSLLLRSLDQVRGRLLCRGPDRKRFLHGMLSNDVKGLAPGQGCPAVLLTVKGRMVADLTVYDCEDGLLLEMEASVCEHVRADLDRHLIMDDAEVVDVSADLHELGLFAADPAGLAAFVAELGAPTLAPYQHALVDTPVGPLRFAATRELGLPGPRVFGAAGPIDALRQRASASGAHLLGDEQAEVLRVEAGVPRYGLDMDDDRLPIEANLDHAVSTTKGCYLGQEPIARLSARGHVNRRLLGLRLHLPEGAALPPRGAALRHPSREAAGSVTTAVQSPRHGPIALGYVHRSLWEPGTTLTIDGMDGASAVVTTLPFTG